MDFHALTTRDVRVSTVEHLLASLSAYGIDNLHVDIDGPEVPILDGSASPFVFLIQSAGIEEQNAPKRFLRIKRPVRAEDDDKWAMFEPFDGFRVGFTIQFDHPAFNSQNCHAEINFSTTSFVKEAGLDVRKPEAATTEAKVRASIMIAVSETGQIWMQKRQIELDAVRPLVEALSSVDDVVVAPSIAVDGGTRLPAPMMTGGGSGFPLDTRMTALGLIWVVVRFA